MKKTPNLFDYATSELSQDAFLTWLIQWADNDYENLDKPLNSCAKLFVQELVGKNTKYKIETVQAGRQWNNIDVWALINNEYFIVIEDKKGSKEHSDQLNRYSEIAEKKYKNSDIKVKLVYFKMEEQGNYNNIKNAGFSILNRSKMISIIKEYIKSTKTSEQNNILKDYYENLKNLDNEVKSYLTRPINEWNPWFGWQGFYTELQKNIGGDWNYVSNRSGGFLGFWWNHKFQKEFHYYLQLEQENLTFKLIVNNENKRREFRDNYRKYLYKKAKELNIGISQFGRLGKHMGVAKLNSEYRIKDEKGFLNLEATIRKLKEIMNLINETDKESRVGKGESRP
tara:strand:- start:10 stop:1029 length:1020 start_codon:yes stop_codon:yes gene_type:complete